MGINEKLTIIDTALKDIKTAINSKLETPISGNITSYASYIDTLGGSGSTTSADLSPYFNRTLTDVDIDDKVTILPDYSFSNYDTLTVNADLNTAISPKTFSGSKYVEYKQGDRTLTYTCEITNSENVYISDKYLVIKKDYFNSKLDNPDLYVENDIRFFNYVYAGNPSFRIYDTTGKILLEANRISSDDIILDCTIKSWDETNKELELVEHEEYTGGLSGILGGNTTDENILFQVRYVELDDSTEIIALELSTQTLSQNLCIPQYLYDNNYVVLFDDTEMHTNLSNIKRGRHSIKIFHPDYLCQEELVDVDLMDSVGVYPKNDTKDGLKITFVPDIAGEYTYKLTYNSGTILSNYATVLPNTTIDLHFIDPSYTYTPIKHRINATTNCNVNLEMQPLTIEDVTLSGEFSSNNYTQDYMKNAYVNGFSVTDNALRSNLPESTSYVNNNGWIKFTTPNESTTIEIDAEITTAGTASGSNWAGAVIFCEKSRIDIDYMNFVSNNSFIGDDGITYDNPIVKASGKESAIARTVYTKELEPNTEYYISFGTAKYSSSGQAFQLIINSIAFKGVETYQGNITVEEL